MLDAAGDEELRGDAGFCDELFGDEGEAMIGGLGESLEDVGGGGGLR